MIGIVIPTVEDFNSLGIFGSVDSSRLIFGDTFDISFLGYDMEAGLCYDSCMASSAITQRLIDDGCSMIFILGIKKIDDIDERICNIVKFNSRYTVNGMETQLVKLTSSDIANVECKEENDIPDIFDGAYVTCSMNAIPLLMLYAESFTDITEDRYSALGMALNQKIESMVKDDYARNDKHSLNDSVPFVPVGVMDYFSDILGRKVESDDKE